MKVFEEKLIPTFPEELGKYVPQFSKIIEFNALISHLKMCPANELPAYVKLLELVLNQPHIVQSMLIENEKLALSTFLGSRLQNMVLFRGIESFIGDNKLYVPWIMYQLSLCEFRAIYLAKLVKLDVEIVAGQLLNDNKWSGFLCWIGKMSTANQQYFLNRGIIPEIRGLETVFKLLKMNLNLFAFKDACLNPPKTTLALRALVLYAKCKTELETLTEHIAGVWSSKIVAQSSDLSYLRALTQILLAACNSLDEEKGGRILTQLMNGVTNYMESSLNEIRNFGAVIAQSYAKFSGTKLDLTANFTNFWVGIDNLPGIEAEPEPENSTIAPNPNSNVGPESQSSEIADASELLGDSDDDDEEQPRKPYFIKDLLKMIQSDEYIDNISALTFGANLVTQKAKFGTEVQQYGSELLRAACLLQDKFSINKFLESKQALLNAIVVADMPQSAINAATLLQQGDFSYTQRQILMAALTHSAKILSEGTSNFTFEQLPDKLHRLFIQNGDIPQIASSQTNTQIEHSQSKKIARNLYAPHSKLTFNALLASKPPSATSIDALYYAQWLRTLGMLVFYSYPSEHTPSLALELFALVQTQLRSSSHEVVILEALYTCILNVVEVAAGVLLQSHANDLGSLFDLLASSAAVESPTGRLATGKIAQLVDSLQRQILES